MKEITEDWLKSAKMDLELIKAIINREDLTPLISFHALHCFEKTK